MLAENSSMCVFLTKVLDLKACNSPTAQEVVLPLWLGRHRGKSVVERLRAASSPGPAHRCRPGALVVRQAGLALGAPRHPHGTPVQLGLPAARGVPQLHPTP